jgi:hypothetical protein
MVLARTSDAMNALSRSRERAFIFNCPVGRLVTTMLWDVGTGAPIVTSLFPDVVRWLRGGAVACSTPQLVGCTYRGVTVFDWAEFGPAPIALDACTTNLTFRFACVKVNVIARDVPGAIDTFVASTVALAAALLMV